ncbi:MAG: hypothetical protein AAGE52_32460 [Myxococcota bacterium]
MNLDEWNDLEQTGRDEQMLEWRLFRKERLTALVSGEAPKWASASPDEVAQALIDLLGAALRGDNRILQTFNSQGWGRCRVEEDRGLCSIVELSRDDEYDESPADTPTIGWCSADAGFVVVVSGTFRDVDVASAVGVDWPAKDDFPRVSVTYGE